jgi:hypothetical protein
MCGKGVCIDPVFQLSSTFKIRSALNPSGRSIPCTCAGRPSCPSAFVNREVR